MKEIYLDYESIIHPEYKVKCKRHKRRTRTIRSASLEGEKITIYHIAQYSFINPNTGKKSYYTPPIKGVEGKKRHDNNTILMCIRPAIENKMNYKDTAEQCRTLLNLRTVSSTIYKWIVEIDIDENSFSLLERKVIEQSSGNLSIDEVYDKEGIIISTDTVKDTILNITVEKNISNDSVKRHLSLLKENGLNAKSFTKDGSPLYVNTIQSVFDNILLQDCIFHLQKGIQKHFFSWQKKIRDKIIIPKLKRGRKKKGTVTLNSTPLKNIKQELFRSRYLFQKKRLSVEEKIKVSNFYILFPELRKLRRLYILFKRIFTVSSFDEAKKRYESFINDISARENIPKVLKKLKTSYDRDSLFTYLKFNIKYRKKIRTTNHTERTNRKFRKKQKTHYKIRKLKNKKKMLKFMMYFHNWKSIYGNCYLLITVLFFYILSAIRKYYHMF